MPNEPGGTTFASFFVACEHADKFLGSLSSTKGQEFRFHYLLYHLDRALFIRRGRAIAVSNDRVEWCPCTIVPESCRSSVINTFLIASISASVMLLVVEGDVAGLTLVSANALLDAVNAHRIAINTMILPSG